MNDKQAQNALSLVSYLFLFVGLVAMIEMARHAMRGYFHVNFGIIGIGIFTGLRRYSRVWRMVALIASWYGIVTISLALLTCIYAAGPALGAANPLPFSRRLSDVPANWLAFPLLMMLLVTIWQFRTLTQPAVRRLFAEEPQAMEVAPDEPVGSAMDSATVE